MYSLIISSVTCPLVQLKNPLAQIMSTPVTILKSRVKLHLDFSRRATLRFLNEVTDTNVRRDRNKKMDMIPRNHPILNLDSHLLRDLNHKITNPRLDLTVENFVAVFRNPNQGIAMMINRVLCFTVGWTHTRKNEPKPQNPQSNFD